jgi:Zinc finger, C3HC4 type (RING finger)
MEPYFPCKGIRSKKYCPGVKKLTNSLGIIVKGKPINTEYRLTDLRRVSLSSWTKEVPSKLDVALAGWFKQKDREVYRCFYCNYKAKNLETFANPVNAHAPKKSCAFYLALSSDLNQGTASSECKICMDTVNALFVLLPCAHTGVCGRCAIVCETCPFCRKSAHGIVKIFLP